MKRKLSYLLSLRQAGLLALILAFALFGLADYVSHRLDAVSASADAGVRLPVVMYHGVLADEDRVGKYVISTQTLREDLTWLYARGYTAVTVQDLVAYTSGGGSLPDKPVMITFDDGFRNNAVLAAPILQEFGYRAVFSVVGAYADAASRSQDHDVRYAYLSWDEIRRLQLSGVGEIQNHTYDMHALAPRKGCAQMAGESARQYRDALSADLRAMQDRLAEYCGVTATAVTLPYGAQSDATREVVRALGFDAMLTCAEEVPLITRDPECLYALGRFNRPAGVSTAAFMRALGIE